MRLIFPLFVALVFWAGGFCFSQQNLIRQNKNNDLDKIFGVCGCTDCNGLPEHNNPVEDDFGDFVLGNRWTSTVLSGGGLSQGQPTQITWSIVPDGTDANGGGGFVPSNMIAFLDNIFNEPNAGSPDYTNRVWWARMQQALDRWGEVSGVEYVYEPNDDGIATFGAGGVLGVRGDVRIGGFNIDGGGGVLAFNALPNDGDMAIDTTDAGLFGNPQVNYLLFRNVITHEAGHGLGIFHLESNNAAFLMEPFISGSFDGPQLDDVRAVHRHYGDVFEKSNNFAGNNNFVNATPLGSLGVGDSLEIGTDGATGTFVLLSDDDFVSVDDNSDLDYYEINVTDLAFANITLTPVGVSYNQSQEGGGGGTPTNPSASSDLTLALFDSGGSLISLENSTGSGSAETIEDEIVAPGTYFIRVTGSANAMQLYTIDVELEEFVAPNSTPPAAITVTAGQISAGSIAELGNSDDDYLELIPLVPDDPNGPEIAALFTVISPDSIVSSFSIDYEVAGNTRNVDQNLSVFNVFTSSFETIDNSEISFTDEGITWVPTNSPQSYVNVGSGVVLLEFSFETTGPTFIYPWTVRIDEVLVNTSQ